MSSYPHILGVDIGSVSIAVVALNSRLEIIQSAYEFHHGKMEQTLRDILNRFELKSISGFATTAETPPILKTTSPFKMFLYILKICDISPIDLSFGQNRKKIIFSKDEAYYY